MSVLARYRRGSPEVDHYYFATTLRKDMTNLLLQDFGIRDKIRSYRYVAAISLMTETDRATFLRICDKYKVTTLSEEFPKWLLDAFRTNIMRLLTNLVKNIVAGDNTRLSKPRRRNAKEGAYIACQQLLEEMQYVMDVVPINVNRYLAFTRRIEAEKEYLSKWLERD